MKIIDGRMVYEPRACYSCGGKGSRDYNVLCPNWNGSVAKLPGRKCPYCDTKNRHSHKTVGTEHKTCDACRGVGFPMETAYDSVPQEIIDALPIKVYRSTRERSWAEEHLGGGLVSVTDYGRHESLSDEEFIAKVRGDLKSVQAVNGVVHRDDHGRICDHLAIVTGRGGYVVVGYFKE